MRCTTSRGTLAQHNATRPVRTNLRPNGSLQKSA